MIILIDTEKLSWSGMCDAQDAIIASSSVNNARVGKLEDIKNEINNLKWYGNGEETFNSCISSVNAVFDKYGTNKIETNKSAYSTETNERLGILGQ